MTKLEELTVLLVNELHEFNKNIERLEKLNKDLKSTKLKVDFSDYLYSMESHKSQMEKQKDAMEQFERWFGNRISGAKIYPTWAVVVFILSVLITIGLVLFVIFSRSNSG